MVKRPGNLTAGHQGALFIIVGLILFKYVQFLRLSALDLGRGSTRRLEVLLGAIFVIWMFPLVGDTQFGALRRSTYLPFSSHQLYVIRLLSPFVALRSWVIAGASAGMFYWLHYTSQPAAALVAIVLFVTFSYFSGLAAADLSATAVGRRCLVILLILASLGVTADAALTGHGVMVEMRRVRLLLPPHLVGRILVGERVVGSLALLAVFTSVAWALSTLATKTSLQGEPLRGSRARTGRGLPILPGKFAGLVAKDLRHFQRLPDLYFGLLVVIVSALYLISAPDPSVQVLWPILILYFASNVMAPFNFFGADDAVGFDRYMLMPLTGKMIILSKNIACLLLVAVQTVPLVCLVVWRMGWLMGFLSLIEVGGMMFCYMSWGNWISISHPRRIHFHRFASEGPLPEILLGVVFGSLPGVLGVAVAVKENNSFSSLIWQMTLIFIASFVIYLGSLSRFGKAMEQRRESIKAALS